MSDNYKKSFADGVRAYELEQVEERRRQTHSPQNPDGSPMVATDEWNMPKGEPLQSDLVGLAFSGGGIRSGTFNLGILQALGRLKLLTRVDYISTVSGGGYIGGWLAAWIRRAKEEGPESRRVKRPNWTPVEVVESRLDPRVNRQNIGAEPAGEPEPETIHHLRAHSRYLAPKFGLFSLDAWTLLAIYTRNLMATSLITVPILLALAVFVRWVVAAFAAWPTPQGHTDGITWIHFGIFVALVIVAEAIVRFSFGRVFADRSGTPIPVNSSPNPPDVSFGPLVWALLTFGLILTAAYGIWLQGPAPWSEPLAVSSRMPEELRLSSGNATTRESARAVAGVPGVVGIDNTSGTSLGSYLWGAIFFGALGLIGGFFGQFYRGRMFWRRVWYVCFTVLHGILFGILLAGIVNNVLFFDGRSHPALFATFGPPLFLLALVVAGYAETALAGGLFDKHQREWRSRLSAWLLLCAAWWTLLFGTVVFLPFGLHELNEWASQGAGRKPIPWGAFVGWLLTTGMGFFAARKTATGSAGPSLRLVAQIVPVIFLIGLLAIAGEVSQELPEFGSWDDRSKASLTEMEYPPARLNYLDRMQNPSHVAPWSLLAWVGLLLLGILLAVFFVPASRFSLHTLYMNRLTRAYLGASLKDAKPGRGSAGLDPARNSRAANDFTGFDPRDDFPLAALRTNAKDMPQEWGKNTDYLPYFGPYPIFNTTLNLVAGKELACQDRKGASFVLTPAFCGSEDTGYAMHERKDEAALRELSLGRAIAVSGAAVDPNMRDFQSPQLTAFLSLLNARLGWWIEKPTPDKDWSACPPGFPFSGWPYLREIAGMTDTSGRHVHLSDGGHFENTGAYELIRRRCRHIVVIDAAEDVADASENLANLIRLVRTDFGIPIDIDTSPIRKDAVGNSRWHCAVGAIRYDEVDKSGVTGTFVFIRPSMTGDEEADLKNYAATNPPFPHHGTADQFFDDAQFESYRQLGFHIGMEVFGGAREVVGEPPESKTDAEYRGYTRRLFAAVRRTWSALRDGSADSYLRSCQDYLQVVNDLRDGEPPASNPGGGLRRISRSLFAEARYLSPIASGASVPDSDPYYTDLHEVDSLLQVMEVAWLENDFDEFAFHSHNRGWMNVLRRWTNTTTFERFWPVLRGQYSRGFVRFCEVALNLPKLPVNWCRINDPRGPGWASIVEQFGTEFHREWSSSLLGIDGINSVQQPSYLANAVANSKVGGKYLAWVITNGRAGEESGWIREEVTWLTGKGTIPESGGGKACLPLGLIVAFDPKGLRKPNAEAKAQEGNGWELLVWIRGPYRTMGLGRECLFPLLENETNSEKGTAMTGIVHELKAAGIDELFVRFPQLSGTRSDRYQRTIWTWFFNDHDFVSRGRDPRDNDPEVIRLYRKVEAGADQSKKKTEPCTSEMPEPGKSAGTPSPSGGATGPAGSTAPTVGDQ